VGTLGKGNELERPVETIAGARLRVGSGWTAQAGVGFGLTRGYGAPLVRGVLSLAFSPPHARPRAVSRWIPPEPPEPPEPSLPPPPPATPVVRVIGDRIILPASVLFALAGDEVTAEGQRVLDEVFALWARHPEWERLLIEGHTDVRGRAAYNLDLSHRRAENVRLGLVRAGAEANRIDAVGLGEARPASDGQTEEHHARNRRVEFVITERRVLE
jgi:outer membrane protein OmpA-like peptidoglycan-associated protein